MNKENTNMPSIFHFSSLNYFLESELDLSCRIFHLIPLNVGNIPTIVTESF